MKTNIEKIFDSYPELLEEKEVQELLSKYNDLEDEIDDLKLKLFENENEKNYSLETELAEFIRTIYQSCIIELDKKPEESDEVSKEDMIKNIKKNIEIFAKDFRFHL